MEAKDLMIGDYVEFPIGIDKVVDIIYVVGRGLCASFAASATLIPVETGKLKPIPLTTEILEKYGFKKDEKRREMYYWNRGIGNNCVSYDKETGIVRIFHVFGHLVFALPLSYVHELQHALKLCGIDKEIEL